MCPFGLGGRRVELAKGPEPDFTVRIGAPQSGCLLDRLPIAQDGAGEAKAAEVTQKVSNRRSFLIEYSSHVANDSSAAAGSSVCSALGA